MKGFLGISVIDWMRKKKREEWISLGFRHQKVDLNDGQGTVIYMWVSSQQSSNTENKNTKGKRPWVVLIHGFGADGLSGWETHQVRELLQNNWQVAVVDLMFLGPSQSKTDGKERSEVFQAECVNKALEQLGIDKVVIVGHSYGGFVAFWMATLYQSMVVGLVIISSGICMKPHDNDNLLADFGCDNIKDVLIAKNQKELLKGLKFTFHRLPLPLKIIPGFICSDLMQTMGGNAERKGEVIDSVLIGSENCPPLPRLDTTLEEKNTLLIWGEEDRIFPLEHAYRFNKHVGGKAEILVLKECGHVPQMEKASEVTNSLLMFLSNKWPCS